ncbi:MAG: hypothetical protein ABIH70_03470 [Chloroflexota bacterium]
MLKRISKIWGVVLTVVLLASLMVASVPVSAALSWGAETGLPGLTDNILAPAGSSVMDFAIAPNNTTVYAVDGTGMRIYKSTNSGATWSALTTVPAAIGTAITNVAVAPDSSDGSVVAVVADGNEVYVSLNGGTDWSGINPATGLTNIYCIDISPTVASKRNLVVGGDDGANAAAAYLDLGAALPGWTEIAGGGTAWTGQQGATAVRAVKFSPNYVSDRMMLAVTENSTTTVLLEAASFYLTKWNNQVAGYTDYDGTKNVVVLSTAGIAPLQMASLVLKPDYSGADSASRIAYVGLAGATAKGGIFRMTDNEFKSIKGTTNIASVDYVVDKLVAGGLDDNTVWRSANPSASSPTITAAGTFKRPGGAGRTLVAWANDKVYAATAGDESAYAVSADDGKSFNDISLIDTVLTNLEDVAVSPDGAITYLVTNDGTTTATATMNDMSVWRNEGGWVRTLSVRIDDGTTAYVNHMARMAGDTPAALYVATIAGQTIYATTDKGETTWSQRFADVALVDLAVETGSTGTIVYGLTAAGSVAKSTNGAFFFDAAKVTGLNDGNMITSVAKDQLVVGANTGGATGVAYSTDGNANWTKITATGNYPLPGTKVWVTADKVANGGYLYATSATAGNYIYRWKIDAATVGWSRITATGDLNGISGNTPAHLNYSGCGIALDGSVLYVATQNGTDTMLMRTLAPTASDREWSTMNTTALLNQTPKALVVSTGKLWGVNTESAASLYSYEDTLAKSGPTAQGPVDKAVVPVNPGTGLPNDVAFNWKRISTATGYELQVALDSAFTQLVRKENISSSESTVVAVLGPNANVATGVGGSGTNLVFNAGTNYYWRVRAYQFTLAGSNKGPVNSPFSKTMSFSIAPAVPFSIVTPALGASTVALSPTFAWTAYSGVVGYEVMVSEDPTFSILEFSHNVPTTVYKAEEVLAYDTTYYWRVRGITGEAAPKKAAPGTDWVNGIFTTMSEPAGAAPPPVVVTQTPAPVVTVNIPPQAPPVIPSYLLWAIIIIGARLVIAVIVLIVRTRRVG